jgi:uncharacterized Zn finger protein
MELFKKKYYCYNCNYKLDITDEIINNREETNEGIKIKCDNCMHLHYFVTVRKDETITIPINDYRSVIIKGIE